MESTLSFSKFYVDNIQRMSWEALENKRPDEQKMVIVGI
jgi:hypothetical protein